MRLPDLSNLIPRRLQLRIAATGLGIVAAILCFYLPNKFNTYNKLTARLDAVFYDSLFVQRGPEGPMNDFVIVEINKSSIQNVNDMRPGVGYPFPRGLQGEVIRKLKRAGAKIIAIDLTFGGEKPGEDEKLAQALREAGNVILAANFTVSGDSETEQAASGQDFPPAVVRDAAMAVAPVDIPLDEVDDLARRFEPAFKHMSLEDPTKDDLYPGFGVRIAAAAAGIPARDLVADLARGRFHGNPIPFCPDSWDSSLLGHTARICYPERPKYSCRYVGYDQVLSLFEPAQAGQGSVDPSIFKDKIVLIGSTDPEDKDMFHTPNTVYMNEYRPGVEVQACIAHTLLSRHYYATFPERTRVALIWLLALSVAWMTLALRPLRALGPAAIALGLVSVGILVLFHSRIFLRPTQLWFAIIFSYALNSVFLYFTEEKRAKEARRHLGRFVGPAVMEKVLDEPHLELGGEIKFLSIVFTDVQGFTSLSEKLSPEDAVAILNKYLTRMVDCIFKYHGTLDKIMGDGIMAYFGAPMELENPDLQAVLCAIEMQQIMREWRRESETNPDLPPIKKRIGIHSGKVIWGEIGSANQVGLTLIGDPVNVAARLEPLNKEYNTEILISEQVQEHLPEWIQTLYRGEVPIRGRKETINAYSVEVPDSMPDEATQAMQAPLATTRR